MSRRIYRMSHALVFLLLIASMREPQLATGQDWTYVVTPGYKDVKSAVSRLEREGSKIPANVRNKLLSEGRALIKVEERYKSGGMPIQRDTKSLNTRIEAFNKKAIRTQEEADRLNTELKALNARADAENARLISNYAAFVRRAAAAFSTVDSQRYVVKNPAAYKGEYKGKTHECVALVKFAAGLPETKKWRPGAKVRGSNIPKGTPIATFVDGKYPQSFPEDKRRMHAAIYDGQDKNGIWVWHQYDGQPVVRGYIPFKGGKDTRSRDGDAFSVITVQNR